MPHAVYRPHMKQKSDVEIMRDAKLEAMGLMRHDKPQMATDEPVGGYNPCGSGGYLFMTLVVGHGTVQETDVKIPS